MTTTLINYAAGMSRDRFKQECALVVLREVMRSIGDKVAAKVEGSDPNTLARALAQWEESRAKVIAAVVETISDSVAMSLGPDEVPT